MIAEIVGLAGAGKSTLSQTLSQRSPAIHCDFQLRKVQFIPTFLVRAVLARLSSLRGGQVSREVLMVMVYMERLHHVLSKDSKSNRSTTFLLDQGPVYCLAYLREFGFKDSKDQNNELWWNRMLENWASTLDIIFWVDARDAVLLKRIQRRGIWHRAKEMSEQEAYEFLTRYRLAYQEIIPRLTSGGGPKVFRFSTDEESVEQIVSKIENVLRRCSETTSHCSRNFTP